MAGEVSKIIVVAQAEGGQAEVVESEDGQAVDEHAAGTEQADAGDHDSAAFPPFDASTFPSQLLWFALTFAALYLLMSKVALPRIGEILEVRRDRIESDLAEADRLREKTDQAIKDYETDLANARAKANAIADETRRAVKTEMEQARTKTETELSKRVAAAEARIQETKDEALANVDEIAAQTVVAIVARITGKTTVADARKAVKQVVKG